MLREQNLSTLKDEIQKLNSKLSLEKEVYDLSLENSKDRDWKKIYRFIAFRLSLFDMDDSPTKAVAILAKLQQYLEPITDEENFIASYESVKKQRDGLINIMKKDE